MWEQRSETQKCFTPCKFPVTFCVQRSVTSPTSSGRERKAYRRRANEKQSRTLGLWAWDETSEIAEWPALPRPLAQKDVEACVQ